MGPETDERHTGIRQPDTEWWATGDESRDLGGAKVNGTQDDDGRHAAQAQSLLGRTA
ncbi:MAG: hypothetical protein AB1679_18805 [Actinomycetota bacterium]